MLISLFAAALDRRDMRSDLFFEWLTSVGHGFFMDLVGEFATEDVKTVAFYILYAYSRDSSMVIMGADWEGNKGIIADMVGLPTHLYDPVLHLENPKVCEVVEGYLDLQGDRDFKQLQMKKDLHQAMQLALLKGARDETGNSNYKVLLETSRQADKLLEDIEELEEIVKSKNRHVVAGKKEIADKREQNTNQPQANVESSPFIT